MGNAVIGTKAGDGEDNANGKVGSILARRCYEGMSINGIAALECGDITRRSVERRQGKRGDVDGSAAVERRDMT